MTFEKRDMMGWLNKHIETIPIVIFGRHIDTIQFKVKLKLWVGKINGK